MQSSITSWLKRPVSILKTSQESPPPNPNPLSTSIPCSPPPETSQSANDEIQRSPPLRSAPASMPPTLKSPSLPPLPPNVELVPLSEDLLPAFKRLNIVSFPISYPPGYYVETMKDPVIHSLTLIALWNSAIQPVSEAAESQVAKFMEPQVIGAIRCRMVAPATLYISTISCLSPYRSYGIATHMLQRITVRAIEDYGIHCVTAHVWEMNEEALEWYKKRGFEVIGKETGYYRKLKPDGAMMVRKWVGVRDLLNEERDEPAFPQ